MTIKILIADDENDVLQSTAMLIRAMGLDPVPISRAGDILDAVAKERPDVILQDLRMPDLDVASLIASLRSNPLTADIPLVFFSANADVATAAARYDVWGYLTKPFDPAELAHLLQQILGEKPLASRPVSERDFRRELDQVFHDFWNLLSAEANYLAILKRVPGLVPDAQQAVHGLDDLVMKMEGRTDRLRTDMLALLQDVAAIQAKTKKRDPSQPSSVAA